MTHFRKTIILFFSIPVLLLSGACATLPELEKDHPANTPWTLSETTERLGGTDPIEPVNRAMFSVTDVLMLYLVRPVSYVYASILPREAVKRIDMVSENLAFPGRMISCFCQMKIKHGGTEFGRFLVNSTVGIAGIFDPAEYYIGWKQRHENMGQAFASWGIGPGCVVILPVLTSTNLRDHIGAAFDSALDIKFILPYAQTIANVNRAVGKLDLYINMTESSVDPYETYKMLLLTNRYIELRDLEDNLPLREKNKISSDNLEKTEKHPTKIHHPSIPARKGRALAGTLRETADYYDSENRWTDSLRIAFFKMKKNKSSLWLKNSFWNTDFVRQSEERSIRFAPELPELPYRFWKNTASKDLVVIVPGVGTHHTGETLNAFAELFRDSGRANVVVFASAMNWSFAEATGTAFPGYTLSDAKKVRTTVKLILDDLKKNRNFVPENLNLAGYSLGALHVLYIAAMEETDDTLNVKKYLAINPPVSPFSSLREFDLAADRSKQWNTRTFFSKVDSAVPKYLALMSRDTFPTQEKPDGDRKPGPSPYRLNISENAASVMAGLSFRMTMREILVSAHRRKIDGGTLHTPYSRWRRFELYREIDAISGQYYAQRIVYPYIKARHAADSGILWETLAGKSTLWTVAEKLRKNPKIRILHNLDDPILSEKEVRMLDEQFGKRIVWFDRGGHLGNLYLREYQQKVLKELLPTGREKENAAQDGERRK